MNKSMRAQSGFTIVELLVVIAVITILLAMLLPALSGAQNRAKKNTELNHLRQIGMAWTMYANNNNDTALPGYIDEDVQERWRIRIEFPYDPDDIDQDADGFDGSGIALPGRRTQVTPQPRPDADETGATWAWRLMPYFDFAYETVLGYHDDADRSARSLVQNREFVARHPAFGYNGLYVGGRWRIGTGERPQFYFSNARKATPGGDGGRVNLVARSVSQIQRTSEVVIFASAMRVPQPQIVGQILDIDPGYHIVTPPTVGEEPQWGYPPVDGVGAGMGMGSAATGGGIAFGTGDPRQIATFASPALIPIGRYNGLVPILHADGSVDTQTPGAMVDQQLWIDAARTRDFMHTLDDDENDFAEF